MTVLISWRTRYISFTPSTNAFSLRLRLGCRSLRSALASICRMRSRVTWKLWPTSSSVCSLAVLKPEAHLDHPLFARRQRAQHLRGVLLQVHADHRFRWRNRLAIFDKVAQVRVFLFADRRLQRDRLLRDLQHLAHLGHRNVHAPRNLLARRLAAQLLH